ncbi:hypothetical protein MKK64_03115 [Methylobacterium sp. E-025]|uniref:hypothetical protein n=1 Tax=Methylobacterium sp. E-025 TaxID=2836561 RepID=UPI001FB898AB|nr:hypothetical protein [Methylobacterium sp. E-025]MCJ2110211.1 hypothetical protein [Methylobacterium sp. E-025]
MFDRNFTADIESDDTDLYLLAVIVGRAIRHLDHLAHLDAVSLDDMKMLIDIKCLYSIIEKSCCLGGLINAIGSSEFVWVVSSLYSMNWSREEGMLCAFLESLLPGFGDNEEDVGAPEDEINLTDMTKWMPHASPVGT